MPPLERYRTLIFLVVIAVIGAGLFALLTYRPAATVITIIPPPPTATALPSATPGPVRVYVSGAVANPGTTYTLPPASRVEDAVKAAGGMTDDADLSRVNLAALLRDGDQVEVPSIRGGRTGSGSADALPTASGPVHINSATANELERLPGVGPAIAQRIIDFRNKNGPFKTLNDLDRVPGVGQSRLDEWKDLIVFD